MKEIWTKDDAEYHGEFVNFDPIWSWPKPAQKPHPPILIGGAGPRTLERVVEYGDGWMPIGGRTGEVLAAKIKELQQMAKDAGRDPIPVSVFGAAPSPEAIERLSGMGVDRILFGIRPTGADEVLPALKRYASAAGFSGQPALAGLSDERPRPLWQPPVRDAVSDRVEVHGNHVERAR